MQGQAQHHQAEGAEQRAADLGAFHPGVEQYAEQLDEQQAGGRVADDVGDGGHGFP
ncbi:hypothetical protein D3C78_1234680 [compost metagenome]